MTQAGLDVGHLTPRADWGEMGAAEHFVQFYETDGYLLNSLGGFVGSGLSTGEAAIVVATKAHREQLEELLQAYGLDVEAARASGQYVALDAAELLAQLMLDGTFEPGHFAETVGGLIKRAGAGRHRVRIFGEMVALLWADGKQDSALRLEDLWNELQQTHPFSLFCAYPMNGFGGVALADPLGHVCAGHSRVIPTESYTALAKPDDRLRAIIQLQQKARTLEAEVAERKARRSASARRAGRTRTVARPRTDGAGRSRDGESLEGRVSCHSLARTTHALERHHRLVAHAARRPRGSSHADARP